MFYESVSGEWFAFFLRMFYLGFFFKRSFPFSSCREEILVLDPLTHKNSEERERERVIEQHI